VGAVYSIISNAREPRTKDQTEMERRWRVREVYSIISIAQGPRTRLKWRVSALLYTELYAGKGEDDFMK
jgi:hypothetical protein